MARLPVTLPEIGRVGTLSAGARKALKNMRQEYGAAEGNRIFIAKAKEKGRGPTVRARVESVYRKGAHVDS